MHLFLLWYWLYCTIVILMIWKNEELQGSVGHVSTLVYPLHWGSTQVEEVWTPHLLYILPVSTNHPIMKLMGVGLSSTPCLPIPNSFFYLLKYEDMLYWGGSVWHAREFGWSRASTASNLSTRWVKFLIYSSIWVPTMSTWVHRVLKYSSIKFQLRY